MATESQRITPSELRKMPRDRRQAILAAAAMLAEPDYRDDKNLTGFEAFSEEELDGDEPDSFTDKSFSREPPASAKQRPETAFHTLNNLS